MLQQTEHAVSLVTSTIKMRENIIIRTQSRLSVTREKHDLR